MKPLYAKELQLLQPAYLTALLLAVVPVWLLPRNPYDSPESGALVPFIFGVAMLALSSTVSTRVVLVMVSLTLTQRVKTVPLRQPKRPAG